MPRHEYNDDSRGPRLQKILAEAGIGSRRACEAMIEAGEVSVNGTLIDSLPAWVDPERDRISVSGRRLKLPLVHVYVMLFKPKGTISTNAEDEERRRLIDLVNHPTGSRLFPVGRLDVDSSGLILLTNDGELANKLTHPRHGISKVYEVTVAGQISNEEVKRLERGVFLYDRNKEKGARTKRSKLSIIKRDRDRTLLRMELHEGRNRQIRRMMLAVGHPVKKLRRVQLGPLKLSGLQAGQWRDLLPSELSALRRTIKKKAARKLGSKQNATPGSASRKPAVSKKPARRSGARSSRSR